MSGYGYSYGGGNYNGYDQNPYRSNSGGGGGWNTGGASQAAGETSPSSASSPSSKKGTSNNQSLRPVTIKQLVNATQTHTDADFKIDGSDISQITFIATIREITEQSTNVTYIMEDGSGAIEVRKWIQTDDTDYQAQKRSGWREGVYVRVTGHLNSFSNKRHVVAYHIRLIKDYNEITYHHFEALYAHLLFTKGLLPSLAGSSLASNGHGFDRSAYNPQNASAAAYPGSGAFGNATGFGLLRDEILRITKQIGDPDAGIHVAELVRQLRHLGTDEDIKGGIEWLAEEGHMYSTVDANHYRLTSNE